MNNKKIIILALIALLLIGVGTFGYSRYQDYKKFRNITSEFDSFQKNVEKIKVKETVRDKFCARANQKFSDGSIICSEKISVKLIDNQKLNLVVWEAEKSLIKQKGKYVGLQYNDVASAKNATTKLYDTNHGRCYLEKEEHENGNIQISLGCSGSAKAEYYPVKE